MCFCFLSFFVCFSNIFLCLFFFFFNDTATTEIYTLSLHDALPISVTCLSSSWRADRSWLNKSLRLQSDTRSEEHTSELQSRGHLVCRLLLEKKKKKNKKITYINQQKNKHNQ